MQKRWPASKCSLLQARNGRQTAPAWNGILYRNSLPKSLEYEHEHAMKFKKVIHNHNRKKEDFNGKKTRRGNDKKGKCKQNNGSHKIQFSLLGTNTNGISNKINNLRHVLNTFQPSVLTLQETKLRKTGTLRLKGYQIFEKIRKSGVGGSLLTAVNENLTPLLISTGQEDDSEVLTVHDNSEHSRHMYWCHYS